MTWRAFIIGIISVAALSLISPYSSFIKGGGWLTIGAFPAGAVLFIVIITLGLNVLLKQIRRGWELSRPELMLIWCLLIVGSIIPTGLGRHWYTLLAGAPYYARRPDIAWEDGGSLERAPAGIVLSKNPRSEAARLYYEGGGETQRVPWSAWLKPLLNWTAFVLLLYLAVFFMCGIIRRQWVDVERLMFPLARVPLEFTEGAAGERMLPELFTSPPFVKGMLFALSLRLVLALPLLFGAETRVQLTVPFKDVLMGTPLEFMYFDNLIIHLPIVGFAFLVPADVSLSVWFFALFSRTELLVAHWLALPEAGGTWSPMMRWQQVGAYLVFAVGILLMSRRHLFGVLRKAVGIGRDVDDSEEPISYPVAFWGFLLVLAGCLVWYHIQGMRVLTGFVAVMLLLLSYLIYARVVAQGGVPQVSTLWSLPHVMEGFGGAGIFTAQGAVVVSSQGWLLLEGAGIGLAPMAINAFRISDVFGKRRRWLFPALFSALLVAIACTTWVVLTRAYSMGAVNFSSSWEIQHLARAVFNNAQRTMTGGESEVARLHVRPFLMGSLGMAFLMFMRARFYWWPVHSIGLLICSSWGMFARLWFPFFLGWLTKVGIMKLAGGRMLRKARDFFIAAIIVDSFITGLSAVVRTLSGGAVPTF
ncbi:MAG: DUF6785 family protein [Candidatus Brocadiia bacterium]